MESNRTRAIALLLVVMVALSGCAGMFGDEAEPESDGNDGDEAAVETVRTDALATMEEAESYTMETNTTVENPRGTVEMHDRRAVDEQERTMRFERSMAASGQEQASEVYIGNGTIYAHEMGTWTVDEIDGDRFWNETFLVDQYRTALESSNASLEGTETIDGEAVHVLSVTPTDEELAGLEGDVSYEHLTYTFYVDEESSAIHRVSSEATVVQAGQEMNVTATTAISDYDESVDVEIPDAALNSTEDDTGSDEGNETDRENETAEANETEG